MEEEVTKQDYRAAKGIKSVEIVGVNWQTLEIKYSIIVKTLGVVIEEYKQRIVATAARRYQQRVDRFRQKSMFLNNQRQFYRVLN